jgi:hypothetical protein
LHVTRKKKKKKEYPMIAASMAEPTCFSTAMKILEWQVEIQQEFNALLKN